MTRGGIMPRGVQIPPLPLSPFSLPDTASAETVCTPITLTVSGYEIVTTETMYTLIAQLSCDQVCSDVQWLRSLPAGHTVETALTVS